MSDRNTFKFTDRLKKIFLCMIVIGLLAVIVGIFAGNVSAQRVWSNILLNGVYFTGISVLGVFAIAAHQIALAGWNIMIKRVHEAITQFIKYGAIVILVIVLGTYFGYHHLYKWSDTFVTKQYVTQTQLDDYSKNHPMSEKNEAENNSEKNVEFVSTANANDNVTADGKILNPYYDKIIAGKSAYLNPVLFILRAILYLGLWILVAYQIRKNSLLEDKFGTVKWYMNTKFWSALFLVVWAVSSSMMAWDWVMSLDPYWYSTLFGWYSFISLWVGCICTTILILVFLKRRGYMPQLNENHLHDLGKYAFGFSIFWTYLWFSQFMLIWYGNLPEETRWFLDRARTDYRFLFWANLALNFLVPFLVLMSRDAKRSLTVLTLVASVLVISHWIDFYVMIMPATVGENWAINYFEIGMVLTFAGTFLYVVFSELAKAPLIPVNHPFFKESLDHHQ